MSYMDDFDDRKPAASRDGEFFAQASDSGTAVLIDAQIFKGNKDPHTYKLLFRVKESKTGANDLDTPRVVLKFLDKGEHDLGFAKTQLATMLGVDANDKEAMRKAWDKTFRVDEKGYTKAGTLCPFAGYEFRYNIGPTKTKKGETQYHPNFSPVKFETAEARKEAVIANRKAYGISEAKAE